MKILTGLTNRYESDFVVIVKANNLVRKVVKNSNDEDTTICSIESVVSDEVQKVIEDIFLQYPEAVETISGPGKWNGATSLGCISLKGNQIRITGNNSALPLRFGKAGHTFTVKLFVSVKGEQYDTGKKDAKNQPIMKEYKETGFKTLSIHSDYVDATDEEVAQEQLREELKKIRSL